MKSRTLLCGLVLAASTTGFAQLNSSVNVEGEYEPLVIETERLNAFPLGYKFELPPSSLDYELTGIVTDFRPDLLAMGVTGRQTEWPRARRRGFVDIRLGSYLNSRVHAGYYILDSKTNTLLADLRFRSTAYDDLTYYTGPSRKELYEGELGLRYTGAPTAEQAVHAEARGYYTTYGHGVHEGALSAGGGYAYTLEGNKSVGIDAKGDFLFPHKVYGNYGVISLDPSFRHNGERISVKAGVDMAFSYDALGRVWGEKFGTFHIAPDVWLQYRSAASVGLVLSATGGVQPSTLFMRAGEGQYGMPWVFSPRPVYTPVDARFGLTFGPFAGFSAEATVRYAVARNVPLTAWNEDFNQPDSSSANLHGLGLYLKLHYAFGTLVKVEADGAYTPQKSNRGIFNGFDRPRWTLEARAEVRPIRKLRLEIGYAYRGVRNCFSRDAAGSLTPVRLPDMTGLNAGVAYSILENLNIYCRGENLLCRRVELLPSLRSEGIVVSGGIYFEF